MTPPIVLTVAGSDSGGGAGVQADLKAFSALGTYGASVITALTAQNTCEVRAVAPVPADFVRTQLETVFDDLAVGAVKIGMLGGADVVRAVAEVLRRYPQVPVVLDPVMVAKSGDRLLAETALAALKGQLVPLATLVTPNLPEAGDLLAASVEDSVAGLTEAGGRLRALGCAAVLVKGGHGTGEICTDVLVGPDAPRIFEAPRLETRNTHGTGCTLSAAIAAFLAQGKPLGEAVAGAHAYLQEAIRQADRLAVGSGHGPVHHFHAVWA